MFIVIKDDSEVYDNANEMRLAWLEKVISVCREDKNNDFTECVKKDYYNNEKIYDTDSGKMYDANELFHILMAKWIAE